MNHIVFCIDNNWIKQCGITIKSILFYNPNEEFTFHILGKKFSNENIETLQEVLNENSKLEFYNVSDKYDSKFVIRDGDYVSVETYYRFFIPELLPQNISKVLYIDADILCVDSLNGLFKEDITNYACGMVFDHSYADIRLYNRLDYDFSEKYFNAGVILMNLDYWRKNNVKDQLMDFVFNNAYKCLLHDQDAINAVLHGRIKQINFSYNFQNFFFRTPLWAYGKSPISFNDERTEKVYWDDIINSLKNPVLIHFNCTYKPWHKECNIPFTKLWRKFYTMQYGITKFRPKPISIKEKIKLFVIKTAVKLKLKKEIPVILHYPDICYEVENSFIGNFTKISNKS